MERIVIHSDLNNFYASVERKLHPELVGVPVAVCGNKEERKGIVLAKSEEAKKFGVKTGDTVWQAKRKCPDIVVVRPHFDEYMKYSRLARAIYAEYTDLIEPYGIDECWLDVTHSTKVFPRFGGEMYEGEGEARTFAPAYLKFIGDTLRTRIKGELGLTVSVGVSYNKVFAKLGSDLKKPDGTTVIPVSDYKTKIYPLPVEDLLYVGRATAERLRRMGITTIGALANAPDDTIKRAFGKNGETLLKYARGQDDEPVRSADDSGELKSIGNSLTYPHDLTSYEEVKKHLFVLAESVAARLREADLGRADTVHLWVRDSALKSMNVQKKVRPTVLCGEIAAHAFALFKERVRFPFAVRALGVTVSGFDKNLSQMTFDEVDGDYKKRERAERAVDAIRKKYGYSKLQRGIMADDPEAAHTDIKGTHLIKPARFDDGGGDGRN